LEKKKEGNRGKNLTIAKESPRKYLSKQQKGKRFID